MRFRTLIVGLAALVIGVLGAERPARAELMTFHLSVGDALASVGKTNAFLVSIGKQARSLKLVPGGTRFAGLTCAGFGDVYKLASVTVLDGPQSFPALVTTKKGKDAQSLTTAFNLAGLTTWTPPAVDAETDRQFWSATQVAHGVNFAAEALTAGNDSGLLDASASAGIFRFRTQVPVHSVAGSTYRFLVELIGQTASTDTGLVAFGQQRCFTFVDLVPLDVDELGRLIDQQLDDPYVRVGVSERVPTLKRALAARDFENAFQVMAYMIGHLVARTPEHAKPAAARRVVSGVFDVRRGLDFRAATAECGNNKRETGEACDGADLGGFSCATIGYAGGALVCQPSCLFDFSQCVANPVCGNGVTELEEECDDGPLNSDTGIDACRTNCKRSYCGDGIIDSFEDCEGSNLNGETCKTLGYFGGSLKCDPVYCEFDDLRCDEGD